MSKPTIKLSQDCVTAVYCTALKVVYSNDVLTSANLDDAYDLADKAIADLKALINAYEGDEV